MQKRQKFNGLECGFDGRHGIDEGGIGGIGPGGGFVEGGDCAEFQRPGRSSRASARFSVSAGGPARTEYWRLARSGSWARAGR